MRDGEEVTGRRDGGSRNTVTLRKASTGYDVDLAVISLEEVHLEDVDLEDVHLEGMRH
jgi:hypothetical protein